jgi:anti-sigma factor RsiW
MEHDEIYTMMMDALDGELSATDHGELESHLRACLFCAREWQALLAIDALFRQTPALSPAVDFAQRTLARLPNRRYRLWIISAVYILLLLSGALPLLLVAWAVSRFGPIMSEPAAVPDLLASIERTLQVTGTVMRALLSAIGEFLIQQPAVPGWLLVMAGIVFLWSGIYQQLVSQPRQVQ